jgi:hypothetical protein
MKTTHKTIKVRKAAMEFGTEMHPNFNFLKKRARGRPTNERTAEIRMYVTIELKYQTRNNTIKKPMASKMYLVLVCNFIIS